MVAQIHKIQSFKKSNILFEKKNKKTINLFQWILNVFWTLKSFSKNDKRNK